MIAEAEIMKKLTKQGLVVKTCSGMAKSPPKPGRKND
jgi:hypothetical protein